MCKILIVLIILQLFMNSKCQILPKSIKKCHYGDSMCIKESMNSVIKHFPKGIPEIGMNPIDRVDIPSIQFWNSIELGGVWLKCKLYNQQIYGFENTTITQIKGFGKDPTATEIEIRGQIPSLVHKGKYFATGSLSHITLNSTGNAHSDFQNFRFILKLKVTIEYRNNKRFLKIYELVPRINMKRWIISMEDLFKENFDLTTVMNRVFNDNWVQFYNEMEPSILSACTDVFTNIIGGIFEKVPYDELFLQKDTEIEIKN